jgi:hypothetical protein
MDDSVDDDVENGVKPDLGDRLLCRARSSGIGRNSKLVELPSAAKAARISSLRVRSGFERREEDCKDCKEILKIYPSRWAPK